MEMKSVFEREKYLENDNLFSNIVDICDMAGKNRWKVRKISKLLKFIAIFVIPVENAFK